MDEKQRSPRRPGPRALFLTLGVCLLLASTGMAYQDLSALHERVLTGQRALARASGTLSGGSIQRLAAGELAIDQSCADLTTAAQSFEAADAGLAPLLPLIQLADSVPGLQERGQSSLMLFAVAGEVSAAGHALCRGLAPLAELASSQGRGDERLADRVLPALAASRPDLVHARASLARAGLALERVQPEQFDAKTAEAVAILAAKLPTLRSTVDTLLLLPELLGADGPRTYLLLAQNREQIYPTGGYIGTAGVIRVAGGRVEHLEFGSSAAYDLPPDRLVAPPAPLAKHLRSSYWHLRDANWWPDFPSSAEQVAYFYNQVRSQPVDGVIAFDQGALELLLYHTGPVEVPEYGETVASDNVQERLTAYVHADPGRDNEWERKAFVGATAGSVLRAPASAPPSRFGALAGAVSEALSRKHILLYLGDPSAAELTARLGWDGHLYDGPGDYLFPVSTNMGPNKVDPYVERQAHYVVDLTASPPRARFTLAVANRFDPAHTAPWPTTNARDYLRVYVPWGSALGEASGFASEVETSTECRRTVFGGLVEVPPGEQATIVLEYTLTSAALEGGPYRLAVQKQPGLAALPLTVEVVGANGAARYVDSLVGDRQYQADRSGQLDVRPLPAPAAASVACSTPKPAVEVLAPPSRIAIPRLDVDAPIVELQVRTSGEMEVPDNGEQVGWYAESARPGYAGNLVAAAHVDWAKRPAVFWNLHDLKPGEKIVVTDATGRQHTYVVEWNRAARPEDVPIYDVVGPSFDRIMTLITCTGNFNPLTRDYSHRQILRARLVDGS